MVESVTMDVLDRIGDDPERRYQFFKAFVELAKKTVANGGVGSSDGGLLSSERTDAVADA